MEKIWKLTHYGHLFTDCSKIIEYKSGGVLNLDYLTPSLPRMFDCIWIIRKPAKKNPDGILLRLTKIAFGQGNIMILVLKIQYIHLYNIYECNAVIKYRHSKCKINVYDSFYFFVYLGWAKYPDNSLEIISGTTSRGDILGRYSASNMTIGQWFSPGPNLYIRLRGALSADDRLNFIFTAVDNVTEGMLYLKYIQRTSPTHLRNRKRINRIRLWHHKRTRRTRLWNIIISVAESLPPLGNHAFMITSL